MTVGVQEAEGTDVEKMLALKAKHWCPCGANVLDQAVALFVDFDMAQPIVDVLLETIDLWRS